MKYLAIALATSLALSAGAAGCAAQHPPGRSGTASPGEDAPSPDGAALGVGPWSLTRQTPPSTRPPALGDGAPATAAR